MTKPELQKLISKTKSAMEKAAKDLDLLRQQGCVMRCWHWKKCKTKNNFNSEIFSVNFAHSFLSVLCG